MKRIPIEKRKIPTTLALTMTALSKLDLVADGMDQSRSSVVEAAIGFYYRWFQVYGPDRADWPDEDPCDLSEADEEDPIPEIPDEVSEIGYNPYTGCYEEDL